MPTKRKRIQVSLPRVLEEFISKQVDETGLPWSSVILTAIARYKEQTEALNIISKLSKEQIDKVLEDD